jgi:hypothetical protein
MKTFTSVFVIIFYSLFLSSNVLQANRFEPVSRDKAQLVAKNFYYERISQTWQISFETMVLKEVQTISRNEVPLYYVVNIHQGFVMVSAYEMLQPVLAYSLEKPWCAPGNQENFKAWMNQYEDQIEEAVAKKLTPTPEITARWEKYSNPDFLQHPIVRLTNIEPMLTSKWDQGKYYNEMCPADPAGAAGHCVTGCVATALGQLAYYFRFPETGTGSYSYYHPTYDTISANFGNTTYKWDEMTNSLYESTPAAAELIFHFGVSVDMVYGPGSSGMYNHKAAYSLRTFFKYSPETQYLYRDSTTLDWDSVIMAHLERKIPMYYAGWSVPNINGHAFILDGCQDTDFYHFNWGWSGSYDGYFYIDQLNPGGSNFNLAQELVINAFPDTNQYEYPTYCAGFKHFTSFNGTFEDGSGPTCNSQQNSDCSFFIDPQSEIDSVSSITLSFQKFDLTENEDFIKIYDGENEGAPLLATFTGNEIPAGITSSGNKMFVVYHAGNSTTEGFFASYASNRPEWCSGMTLLNAPTSELSDGSFNFLYQNNTICMWQIVPPGAGSTTLYFTKFDTEPNNDILKIYNLANSTLLATISGHYDPADLPLPVTSPSGKMFITFTTNSTVRADGWDAWYLASPVGIDEKDENAVISVHPNPANDELFVNITGLSEKNPEIKMLNYLGKIVYSGSQFTSPGNLLTIDVSDLTIGIYFVQIKNNNTNLIKKLIIQH